MVEEILSQNDRVPSTDTSIAVSLNAAFKVASSCGRGKCNLTCIEVLLTGNNNKIGHITEGLFRCLAGVLF